jgi:hypothetical protein
MKKFVGSLAFSEKLEEINGTGIIGKTHCHVTILISCSSPRIMISASP